jgi:hypothetical protein
MRQGFEKGLEIFGKAKGLWETGKQYIMVLRQLCHTLMMQQPLFLSYCKYEI